VRGKKEKNRVYTRQARGWSHRSFWTSFKFFGRYGYRSLHFVLVIVFLHSMT